MTVYPSDPTVFQGPDDLPPVTIRPFEPRDTAEALASFNEVFADVDPTFEPRPPEEWAWRYEDNPCGHKSMVAASDDGKIAAFQGGIPFRVRMGDSNVLYGQLVDSFCKPAYAKGLSKPGLFAQMVADWSTIFGGVGKDQFLVMVGLPVRSAYRIGQKVLFYFMVRSQMELRARLDQLELNETGSLTLDEPDDFPDDVDAFFERVAPAFGVIAVRDYAFLSWRFTRNPLATYSIGCVRRHGELVGYAVFTPGAFDQKPSGMVADWLVDPSVPEARHLLLDWLATKTRAADENELCFVLPDVCPDFRALQLAGFRASMSSYITTAGRRHPRFHANHVTRDWYYTMAEFDLC